MSVGMLFLIIFNLVLGVSLIIFYPYLNANILVIIQFLGYIFVLIGIIVCLFPFFRIRLVKAKKLSFLIILIFQIIAYFTMILIPIGLFLGITMKRDLQEMKDMIKERKEDKKEKNVVLYYLILTFGGLTHVLIGSGLLFLLIPIVNAEIDFLYPYITFDIIIFLKIIGWWTFIPGVMLLFCSIWSRFLARSSSLDKLMVKSIKIVINVASLLVLVIFSFGTFFGVILLQEFRFLKSKSDELE